MDSERLDRWISVGANIGVLIGLCLLVVEIRQNSDLARISIEQSRSESFVAWQRQRASNDALAALFAKIDRLNSDGASDIYEELDPIERARVRAILSARYYDYENLYSQYERGFISEEYWRERVVPTIRAFYYYQWVEVFGPEMLPSRQAFKQELERIREEPIGEGED